MRIQPARMRLVELAECPAAAAPDLLQAARFPRRVLVPTAQAHPDQRASPGRAYTAAASVRRGRGRAFISSGGTKTMNTHLAAALLLTAAEGIAGCAHLPVQDPALAAPAAIPAAILAEDHFQGDRIGTLSEGALRAILEAPVALDESQRIGVLTVTDSYRPERGIPLPGVPAELARGLEASGFFQAASEMTTDRPAGGDVPGLRELAARYRSGYLLLYRQRFVDDASRIHGPGSIPPSWACSSRLRGRWRPPGCWKRPCSTSAAERFSSLSTSVCARAPTRRP